MFKNALTPVITLYSLLKSLNQCPLLSPLILSNIQDPSLGLHCFAIFPPPQVHRHTQHTHTYTHLRTFPLLTKAQNARSIQNVIIPSFPPASPCFLGTEPFSITRLQAHEDVGSSSLLPAPTPRSTTGLAHGRCSRNTE